MISHRTNMNYPKLFKRIDDKTFYLSSNGIFNRLIQKAFNYTIKCIIETDSRSSLNNFDVFSFYLSHLLTIFKIYSILLIIALKILICEIIAFKIVTNRDLISHSNININIEPICDYNI